MLDKFVSIILAIIKNPYEYFSTQMSKDNSVKEAIVFAIIVLCASLFPYVISTGFYIGATSAILSFVFLPLLVIIGLYTNTFLYHSLIFLFCPKRSNFKQTFKVLAYSYAGAIFMVVPVVGWIATTIFTVRATIFGLSAVHNVSALKVFMLFVIVPIILVMALGILIIAAFGAALMPFYKEILSSF